MKYLEMPLGKNVRFLLPSLKLKEPCESGELIEQSVHKFLVERFGGYTATTATVFGYWREPHGGYTYGEHREFTVALQEQQGLSELKEFLARTARTMRENCLYFEVAGAATLLSSGPEHAADTLCSD